MAVVEVRIFPENMTHPGPDRFGFRLVTGTMPSHQLTVPEIHLRPRGVWDRQSLVALKPRNDYSGLGDREKVLGPESKKATRSQHRSRAT